MKSFQPLFLVLLLGLLIRCQQNDTCVDAECGPGDCVEGICDCPDGFTGVNCEIKDLCFGTDCINGDCDLQTETCNCDPNYYGESCDIYCVNGIFENGDCDCFEGYEGFTCETEIRCRWLGWWSCSEWTWASQIGGSPSPGFLPASIKIEEGYNIPLVELFPTENLPNGIGLMLLSSDNRIVGQVTENTINFELQYLTPERTVYGSATLGNDRILSIKLYLFNPTTSFTEVARGTFTLLRNITLNSQTNCI